MIDHAGTVNCNKGSHGGFIAQPVSHWEGGDVHPTLVQEGEAIAFDAYNQTASKVSQTVTCAASDANHVGTVLTPQVPMAVRRLTPVECERLQGFPDNWSRISWKGKPETECPDGPRYKACGNSMAVPVMAFIGRQIAAVDSTLPPHA
jgi:site-specific DNA-cytosine methylase